MRPLTVKRMFHTFVSRMNARRLVLLVILVAAAGGYYLYTQRPPGPLVLTGVVTTNDVVVAPQIGGRLEQLLVSEGAEVKEGQLLAVLSADELRQERAFYAASAEGTASQVSQSEAALRLQERQNADQLAQAEATLAAAQSDKTAADATLANARVTLDRTERMQSQGIATAEMLDAARTAVEVASARVTALDRQIDAQRAAVALARANAEQVSIRQSQLQASQRQQTAAAAQQQRATVRLAYTEVHAPISGIVDVRAARAGEIVNAGQPILTLIDPNDLWVRADVEESYVQSAKLGDHLTVRLPSGQERQGTVFYRSVDAGFATQRDVSRTKRDIKTFEVRLRLDNSDRALAVGMTAYVLLPPQVR